MANNLAILARKKRPFSATKRNYIDNFLGTLLAYHTKQKQLTARKPSNYPIDDGGRKMKGIVPEAKVTVKKRSLSQSAENSQAGVEVSRGAMAALSVVPALIGAWAAACFVGGLIASGSPLALLKSWFSAVTGM
jgi:hypothetical protein